MLGGVSTLMCHSNEPLLRISGHFTVTGCSSSTPHPHPHTHICTYCNTARSFGSPPRNDDDKPEVYVCVCMCVPALLGEEACLTCQQWIKTPELQLPNAMCYGHLSVCMRHIAGLSTDASGTSDFCHPLPLTQKLL